MKRYAIFDGCLERSEDGDWVRYTDVVAYDDLLAACKGLLSNPLPHKSGQDAVMKARRALAKARGETL